MLVAHVVLDAGFLDAAPADFARHFSETGTTGMQAAVFEASRAGSRVAGAAAHVDPAALAQIAIEHGVGNITHLHFPLDYSLSLQHLIALRAFQTADLIGIAPLKPVHAQMRWGSLHLDYSVRCQRI